MNIRAAVASVLMLSVFVSFLFWLYSVGKISVAGIIILVFGGLLFVGISHLFYKKMWSESE